MLRAVDFGESDLIVHLLTPASGRLTAIAKGARRSTRRFPGTLDLFNHLRVEVERPPARVAGAPRAGAAARRLRRAAHATRALRARLLPARAARSPRARGRGAARPRAALRLRRRALAASIAARPTAAAARAARAARARGARAAARAAPLRALRARALPGDGAASSFHVAEGGPALRELRASRGRRRRRPPRHAARARAGRCASRSTRLERLALAARAPCDEAQRLLDRFQRFHVGVELAASFRAFLASRRARRRRVTAPEAADRAPLTPRGARGDTRASPIQDADGRRRRAAPPPTCAWTTSCRSARGAASSSSRARSTAASTASGTTGRSASS